MVRFLQNLLLGKTIILLSYARLLFVASSPKKPFVWSIKGSLTQGGRKKKSYQIISEFVNTFPFRLCKTSCPT